MRQAIPELDEQGLRRFGFVTGSLIALIFGVLAPWALDAAIPLWPWVVAGVLVVWALLAPGTLNGVYAAWMRLGLLLNRVTSPIIIGAVFFLVLAPIGVLMRLAGRDPLRRGFETRLDSYRLPSRKAPKENLEKPF